MKVRLRYLYLLACTFSFAYATHSILERSYVNTVKSEVLAAETSSSDFYAPPGMPDPNEIYSKVNAIRISNGLQPLERNDRLAQVATSRAQDMSHRVYYAHKNPDGLYYYDLLKQSGYDAGYSCENLDLEFTMQSDTYINSWLGSKAGHKECLLNPKTSKAGYAVATIGNNSTVEAPSYVVVAIYSAK